MVLRDCMFDFFLCHRDHCWPWIAYTKYYTFSVPRYIGRFTRIKSWPRRIKEEVVINSNSLFGEAEVWREQAEEYSREGAYRRSRLSQQKEIKKAKHDKNTDFFPLVNNQTDTAYLYLPENLPTRPLNHNVIFWPCARQHASLDTYNNGVILAT